MANFIKGIGRLSTDRFSFQEHIDGEDFRHNASSIDVSPTILGGATTVQSTLSNIADFIAQQTAAGQGFITIGDGYDTWHAADGSINFDNTIPSLDLILNYIFTPMVAGNAPPAGYERISNGGLVVIKSGTYIVKDTIVVPPGVTLIGEGFGTKIVNATNLDTSVLPPTINTAVSVTAATNASPIVITTNTALSGLATGKKVNIYGVLGNDAANGTWTVTLISPTQFSLQGSTGDGAYTSGGGANIVRPIFRIAADSNRTITDAAIDTDLFMFSKYTRILNMVLADNFVQNTVLGDVYYKIAQSAYGQIPLVQQESGSSLILDNVSFMGRYNSISVTSQHAIKLDSSLGDNGTILKINNCFIDGFKIPIHYETSAGSYSFLEAANNKIRAYGGLDGYDGYAKNNCFIYMNDNNASISNNYFLSDTSIVNTLVYINEATIRNVQAQAKISIVNNEIAMDRASNTSYPFYYLKYNEDVVSTSILINSIRSMIFGNSFDGTVKWKLTSNINTDGYGLSISNSRFDVDVASYFTSVGTSGNLDVDGYATVVGEFRTQSNNIFESSMTYIPSMFSSATYNVTDIDYILLPDTTSNAITINLPEPSEGRLLIIKDRKGTFASNNVTVHRTALGIQIDGIASDVTLSINKQMITLYCDGTNWLILNPY